MKQYKDQTLATLGQIGNVDIRGILERSYPLYAGADPGRRSWVITRIMIYNKSTLGNSLTRTFVADFLSDALKFNQRTLHVGAS